MGNIEKNEIPLSASVVMYGGQDDARKCLESLEQQNTAADFSVFLIDNNSPDGALEKLLEKPLPKRVQVLPQKENLGYGTGHNKCIPLLNSKYHAVVNPDIVLNEDAIGEMARWMEKHPDVAITTPALVFPGGQPQHIAKRRPAVLPLLARQLGFKFLKKYEEHYLMLDEDLSNPTDVEFCSGCFFVIRTDVFKKMGGFDEKYFMYVEDADITQKALKHGRAVYLPQVTVTHAWQRAAHHSPRQFFWQVKSMGRYFKKWGFRFK